MKSRKLTIAECCLLYGVGAYNIDACRIGSEVIRTFNPNGPNRNPKQDIIKLVGNNSADTYHTGRFPSNFILQHTEDCEYLVEVEGTSQVAKWNCSPHCPCKLLDEQSGIVKTGTWNQTDGARTFNNNGKKTNYKTVQKIVEPPSGASRFFKQIDLEDQPND